jgi:hypothetical protein
MKKEVLQKIITLMVHAHWEEDGRKENEIKDSMYETSTRSAVCSNFTYNNIHSAK